MNAVVTRNRELISRSGSHVRAADGVAKGGRPPSPFCFFFLAKSVTFQGVFFIDVICVQTVFQYHPLPMHASLNACIPKCVHPYIFRRIWSVGHVPKCIICPKFGSQMLAKNLLKPSHILSVD